MNKEYLKEILVDMFNYHQQKKAERLIKENVPFWKITAELNKDRNFFHKEVLNG